MVRASTFARSHFVFPRHRRRQSDNDGPHQARTFVAGVSCASAKRLARCCGRNLSAALCEAAGKRARVPDTGGDAGHAFAEAAVRRVAREAGGKAGGRQPMNSEAASTPDQHRINTASTPALTPKRERLIKP